MTRNISLDEQAAADLLVHYVVYASERHNIRHPDCQMEVRSIIRSTIEAAVQQVRAELQPQIDNLTRMVGELSATVTALEKDSHSPRPLDRELALLQEQIDGLKKPRRVGDNPYDLSAAARRRKPRKPTARGRSRR